MRAIASSLLNKNCRIHEKSNLRRCCCPGGSSRPSGVSRQTPWGLFPVECPVSEHHMDDVATTGGHPDDGGVVLHIFGAFSVVVGLGDGSCQKAHLTDRNRASLSWSLPERAGNFLRMD